MANKKYNKYYKKLKYDNVCDGEDFDNKYSTYRQTFIDEFTNLLANAIKIKGLPFTRQAFCKMALIKNGCVGYDKLIDIWASINGTGINEEGNPINGRFLTPNGATWLRQIDYTPTTAGAYILYSFPNKNAIIDDIENTAELCAQLLVGIRQNIIATQTPDIVVLSDPSLELSIEHAIAKRRIGQPVIVTSSQIGEALKGIKNETTFIADKQKALLKEIKDDFLTRIGILTANTDKRERVQTAEISASVGECVDSIYTMIDTLNEQFKQYDLPFKVELNSVIEDYYTPNNETGVFEK